MKHDMEDAVFELEQVLLEVQIPVIELIRGGGGEGEPHNDVSHVVETVWLEKAQL
ncbi:MAG: hypothetical protein R3F37_03735 [Candidatus Competibacteraceae bacterium]